MTENVTNWRREVFAADRFCGKDGMSSDNLETFNTLGDLTIYYCRKSDFVSIPINAFTWS